jgi:hypothetical protein
MGSVRAAPDVGEIAARSREFIREVCLPAEDQPGS